MMINTKNIYNPILRLPNNLRDPSVFKLPDRYLLFYTRYVIGNWNLARNWYVSCCETKDFVTFSGHRDITAENFASPGDVVHWHGRWIMPFQSYPVRPQSLFFVESDNGMDWSAPKGFLEKALNLPWNTDQRAIDPSFVVHGRELHCFFVGSEGLGTPQRANLLGHAVTEDPTLQNWRILTPDSPLMGRDRAPDGVENVVIYRAGGKWLMMLSEGMENQHLALAESQDLITWRPAGIVEIAPQPWFSFRHGAPFIWQEEDRYYMVLMGEEDASHRSSLGFLTSADGFKWEVLPSRD